MALLSTRWLKARMFRSAVTRPSSQRTRLNVSSMEDRITPATITVTTLDDNVTDDADVTLREAIVSINNGADVNDEVTANRAGVYGTNDTIVFQGGLTGTITLGGTELPITAAMAINGPGKDVITVNANDLSRVFNVDDSNANKIAVSISGLTIEEGLTVAVGGAIRSTENLTLTGVTVTDSKATMNGGGIWNGSGTLTITDSLVSLNESLAAVPNTGGGGIYNGGTLTLSNVTVDQNLVSAGTADGGGLFNDGTAFITDGVFSQNTATRAGGGIETQPDSLLSIIGTTFDQNVAGVNGGALHISGTGVAFLDGVTVTGNTAMQEGGGLWNSKTGSLTISDVSGNVLISGNDALGNADASGDVALLQGGGGIFNDGDGAGGGGTLSILDSSLTNAVVISNNTASGLGGAGKTAGSGGGVMSIGGMVDITGAAIDSNEAVRAGGGVEIVSGTVTITNSKLTNNDVSSLGGINVATPGNGGGLHITKAATVTIDGGTVTGNVAEAEGGGLWNSKTGTLVITDANGSVLIMGNVAKGDAAIVGGDFTTLQGGGGIFNDGDGLAGTGGTLMIQDASLTNTVTISNNLATGATRGSGGGILSIGGPVNVTGATIDMNEAVRAGGGVEVVTGTVTLTRVGLTNNDVSVAGTIGTASPGNGGGLHITGDATVTIDSGTVTGNKAEAEGGGLWNSKTGTLIITDASGSVLIDNNTAAGDAAIVGGDFTTLQGGGGIFNDGDGLAGTGGTLTILDTAFVNTVTISNNLATGAARGSGGGILTIGGDVTITGAVVSGNEAIRAGGGIEIVSGPNISLSKVMVTGNDVSTAGTLPTANPGNGGGLHITADATVNIDLSTFTMNAAGNEGGGLWNSATGDIQLSRSTVDGNSAPMGGGIFQDGGTGGAVGTGNFAVMDSTISNNTATLAGGGVQSENGLVAIVNSTISGNMSMATGGGIGLTDGTVSLANSTVAFNSATTTGGGVEVTGGTFTTVSSIIAKNTGATGPDVNGTATSTGNNLFGSTMGLTIAGGPNDLMDVDPLLGPLAINGGPTQTHALQAGSPALNTGSNTLALANDQRGTGFARTFGSGTDIGAFEAQPIASTITLMAAPTTAVQGQPVTLTATVASSVSGSAAPTGTVTFVNQTTGETLGTATLMNGIATLVVSSLPVGMNMIVAMFNGNPNASASTSAPVTVTITATPVPPTPTPLPLGKGSAFGAGQGGSQAILRGPDGTILQNVTPFGAGFTGGVRVASGDFNGDGVTDLVVGNGPGIASQVLVLDGKTGATLFSVNPFEASFLGGVFVTAGDINRDGVPELIITPDQGGGPRVQVYDGATFGQIADFFGITDDPGFRGGARAGVADINGDGFGDLIVSAGFLGGPRVAVFTGTSFVAGMTPTKLINDIFVFEDTLRNGAFVTGADVNGDGFAELIAGAGPDGGPRVVAFDGKALVGAPQTQTLVSSFFAGDPDNRDGVPVAVSDYNGDGLADLLTGVGEPMNSAASSSSPATIYAATSLTDPTPTPLDTFDPFPAFNGGLFVG